MLGASGAGAVDISTQAQLDQAIAGGVTSINIRLGQSGAVERANIRSRHGPYGGVGREPVDCQQSGGRLARRRWDPQFGNQ
jgi:hypothetical protein